MPKGKVDLTADDIIATLRNSSIPSVVVEGKDDIVIFRRLEDVLAEHFVSVFPVGGQDKVLEAFRRRDEVVGHKNIVFVADRDRWVYEGIPEKYLDSSLVFTNGYSIENDVTRDGDFLSLMTDAEKQKFSADLALIIKWFALAMSRFLAGFPEPLNTYPPLILEIEGFDELASEMINNEKDSELLYRMLLAEPFRFLRGKTLFSLIMLQLTYKGRVVHHQNLPLMDTVGAKPGELISQLFDAIKAGLKL